MKIPAAKAAVEKEWGKLEKIPAWHLTKVRNKKEVIAETRNECKNVQFASLMDICHLMNSELEPKSQKYKGKVVLTEQGSSASRMAAAKVMDYMSRPPGCPGQAADAVSAYTQVKVEDAPSLSEVRMSRYLDTSTTTQMAKIMVQYGRSSRSS